jgi:hypothetical protein
MKILKFPENPGLEMRSLTQIAGRVKLLPRVSIDFQSGTSAELQDPRTHCSWRSTLERLTLLKISRQTVPKVTSKQA